MIKTIEVGDKLYALVNDISETPEEGKSQWYGKEYEQLQGSLMHYDWDKTFKTHKHVINPRTIKRTQECFVVIKGKIQIDMYIKEKYASVDYVGIEERKVFNKGERINHLGTLTASTGEAIFVYDGFHKLTVLENDSLFYEIKCGSFSCVSDDKEFLTDENGLDY